MDPKKDHFYGETFKYLMGWGANPGLPLSILIKKIWDNEMRIEVNFIDAFCVECKSKIIFELAWKRENLAYCHKCNAFTQYIKGKFEWSQEEAQKYYEILRGALNVKFYEYHKRTFTFKGNYGSFELWCSDNDDAIYRTVDTKPIELPKTLEELKDDFTFIIFQNATHQWNWYD